MWAKDAGGVGELLHPPAGIVQYFQTGPFLLEIVLRHVSPLAVRRVGTQLSRLGRRLEGCFEVPDFRREVVARVVLEGADDLRHVVAEVVRDGAHRPLHVLAAVTAAAAGHRPLYPLGQ